MLKLQSGNSPNPLLLHSDISYLSSDDEFSWTPQTHILLYKHAPTKNNKRGLLHGQTRTPTNGSAWCVLGGVEEGRFVQGFIVEVQRVQTAQLKSAFCLFM